MSDIHDNRAQIHDPTSFVDRMADAVAARVFTLVCIVVHAAWFALWFAARLDVGLLTNIVSLEAIFLFLVLGIAQNRQAIKDRLRDDVEAHEVDLLTRMNEQQLEILSELRAARDAIQNRA